MKRCFLKLAGYFLLACGVICCALVPPADFESGQKWLHRGLLATAQGQTSPTPAADAGADPPVTEPDLTSIFPSPTPALRPAADGVSAANDDSQPPLNQSEVAQPVAGQNPPLSPSDPFSSSSTPSAESGSFAGSTATVPPQTPTTRRELATGSENFSAGGAQSDVALRWNVPEAVNLGQETDCRLVVTNTAADTAVEVVVEVRLSENARLGQCDPRQVPAPPGEARQSLVWRLGSMVPGMSKTIHIGLTPTAIGELSPVAAVTFNRVAKASVAILQPRLELSVDGPAHAVIGQRSTYRLNVSNHGSGAAANVVVEAQVPAGLSADPQAQLRYQIGTLAAGESRHVDLPLRGLDVGNHAIAAAVYVGGAAVARTNHAVEIVRPVLNITLEGPKLRYLNRKATYVVTVENPSPIAINNVQVLGQVPQGFRFVEATGGGSFDPAVRQVAWFVGKLEPNSSATVAARLVPGAVGDHKIAAAVRADAGVTGLTETATRVEGVSSVVIEVSDADDPVEVQGQTVYTIRLTNQGSKLARNVQVAAVLPDQMQVVSVDGPTSGAVDGDRVIFEPLETLDVGATQEYRVQVLCGGAGKLRFRAFLRTEENTDPIIEEEQTHVYED